MTGWRVRLAWVLAAVAGLVLAAGLTTAASTLSRQRIGLSSEPLTAGRALAPTPEGQSGPAATATARPRRPRHTPTSTPTATATATAAPTFLPTTRPTVPPPTATARPRDDSGGGDDSSGGGHGGGGQGGGDD